MKRKGSTTLFVLIISAVCLPIIVFAWQTLFIESKLNSNRINKVQGQLNLETEINRIVYNQNGINDNIIKIIKKYPNTFFKDESVFNMPVSSSLIQDLTGQLSFENEKDDRPKFKLKIDANYNDIEFEKDIIGGIFKSEIDDCDNGLVYSQGRSQDYIDEVEELLTEIPDSLHMDFLPKGHSLIRTSNYKDISIIAKPYGPSKLHFDKSYCNYVNIASNKIILIVEWDGFNKNNVLIDCSGYDTVPIYGIIYIENGDLTFKANCDFQGIVLIKDGEIKREGGEISTIRGKAILNSFKDPREAVGISYDSSMYLKYAKYLAPLIEPEIIK